ncbi:MAG: hypothetical protein IKP40_06705 [Clostridia bacterium]|nr:hypothetical protein [Clostridia bacterium]
MVKKALAIILYAVLLAGALHAAADEWTPLLAEDGWSYIGYTYGGITFAVPDDYADWELDAEEKAQGYVLLGGNADFTVQLRVFSPDQLSYDDFKARVAQVSSADAHVRMDGDREILVYRNTTPDAYSELYGIAMTGLDGLFYKISIFTGENGAFDEDAPVWKIAEIIGQTARHQDFSEWGISDTPGRMIH